jgi:hypothetical protein
VGAAPAVGQSISDGAPVHVGGPPAAPVDQQLQHLELGIRHDRAQPSHPRADQRDQVRVRRVGLAALPRREHPGPRRQLGRHVDHDVPVRDQPVGDVSSDALAALDGPHTVGPCGHVLEHRGVALDAGVEPAAADDDLVGRHHLDRDAALVRVHPDHDPLRVRNLLLHVNLPRPEPTTGWAWRAPLLRAEQSLLEPLLPGGARAAQPM